MEKRVYTLRADSNGRNEYSQNNTLSSTFSTTASLILLPPPADDNHNNNNNTNAHRSTKSHHQTIRIILTDCLHKLLWTGTDLQELSSCLLLASSSGNLDAVILILEQITKWNNSNYPTTKHNKSKKQMKQRKK